MTKANTTRDPARQNRWTAPYRIWRWAFARLRPDCVADSRKNAPARLCHEAKCALDEEIGARGEATIYEAMACEQRRGTDWSDALDRVTTFEIAAKHAGYRLGRSETTGGIAIRPDTEHTVTGHRDEDTDGTITLHLDDDSMIVVVRDAQARAHEVRRPDGADLDPGLAALARSYVAGLRESWLRKT